MGGACFGVGVVFFLEVDEVTCEVGFMNGKPNLCFVS